MPKIQVKRSVLINSPADKVYQVICDFNHWTSWSPWLIMEPEAKVEVAEDAKSYSWEGSRVGSGKMKISDEKENQELKIDLNFLKPWKSYAAVKFELNPKADQTELTWYMDSSLPFFMFWMKKQMEAYVGNDYERGLALLKDYVEDDKVHSELSFEGVSVFKGCKYVGVKTSCSIDSIGAAMEKDFEKLWGVMKDNSELVAGNGFSMYHKWDFVSGKAQYTSGIPVLKVPENLPSGFISGEIPETKVHTVSHTGPYGHLGNAWSTQYNMQRNKEFKLNKKIHPFEVYRNNPNDVSEHELITDIHFPVK